MRVLRVLRAGPGFALIFVGIGIVVWRKAQDKVALPVDLPLQTSAHEVNIDKFSVLKDANYVVAISAEQSIPTERLDCLLGIELPFEHCQGISSAVNADWVLSSGGMEIAHGSSSTERTAGWSKRVWRGIGHFQARRGQSYKLDIQFLSGISPLAPTRPRIQIYWLDYDEYGDSLKNALAIPVGGASVFIGAALLIFDTIRSARTARRKAQ